MSDVLDPPIRQNQDGDSTPIQWSRVSLMELNTHWGWLAPRLMAKYPWVGEREIRSNLLACIADNDQFFVCNARAVGLFGIVREVFQQPFVKERFVLCANPPDDCDFAEHLYSHAADWTRRQGIGDLHAMVFSDAGAEFAAQREAKALGRRAQPKVRIFVLME
jgi:hypothetical protein